MSKDNQPKVVARNPEHHAGFQSQEARDRAQSANTQPSEDGGEAVNGEISDEERPRTVTPTLDVTQLVQIRSRQAIPSFTFGKKRYQIEAGRVTVVPLAVKMHLEEKGLL